MTVISICSGSLVQEPHLTFVLGWTGGGIAVSCTTTRILFLMLGILTIRGDGKSRISGHVKQLAIHRS